MHRFAEIFDDQTCADRTAVLNERAEAAGWTVLHPGECVILDEGIHSLVISGVIWSKPDLAVLDELAAHDTSGTRVWFFNPDYVFPDARILPDVPRMFQTPALAEYSGKCLVDFVQGGAYVGGVIDRIRNLFPSRPK